MTKNQVPFSGSPFSTYRLPVIVLAVTSLQACALLEPREGPPAPVEQMTPSHQKPRPRTATTPPPTQALGATAVDERMTRPKTVAPAKPKTKVYVYRDPSSAPDAQSALTAPEAVAPAESAESNTAPASADSAPAPASEPVAAAPAPVAPSRTPSVAVAKQALAAPAPAVRTSPPPAPVVVAKAEPPRLAPPVAASKPATPPVPAPAPPVVRVAPPPPPPAPPISAPPLPPAAQALAAQAEQQRKAGDYTGAAASLERSLRIAPREPYLWNRLARVRMEQGQTHQAGNLAARANDLSGKNAEVKQDNWRIIAHSKRQAGDTTAADAAQQRADAD